MAGLDQSERNAHIETALGRFPSNWTIASIGELADFLKAGGTPRRTKSEYWGPGLPFVKIDDLVASAGELTRAAETISPEGLANSSAWEVPEGSILLAMYASIGEVAINRLPVATNQAIIALRPNPAVADRDFVYFALRHARRRLVTHNVQTTQRNVSKSIIERFAIALPPLVEQRSIAAALRTADREFRLTATVVSETERLKRSLSEHLFTFGARRANGEAAVETSIGPIPADWKLVELGDLIVEGPKNGLYRPETAYGSGTPILRIEDFANDGEIVTTSRSRVSVDGDAGHFLLKRGDIVLNRVNSLSHLGKVALIAGDDPLLFESNMMRFRVDENVVLPEFVFRYLGAPRARRQVQARAKRAVAQSSINQGDVRSILCPVPPVDEQRAIARFLRAVDRKWKAERSSWRAQRVLFQTLMQDLLDGNRRAGGHDRGAHG
jgi:type I restriction enzyme S subunit